MHAQGLAAPGQGTGGGVELVGAIRIARTRRTPRVVDRSGNFQRLLDLRVVVPHFAPVQRPIGAVAEYATRPEPVRPEAQRNHGKMHGRSADGLAAVIAAHLQRIVAVDDAVVGPIELGLLGFVGSEVLQRPEKRTGIERND